MTGDSATVAEPGGITLGSLLRALLRRRGLVIGCGLVGALLAGTTGLLRHRTWTAAATFMPQGRRNPAAGLSGVAAQLGITIPTTDAGQGPGFYADFVSSRTMIGALADTTFEITTAQGSQRATLADLYGVRRNAPALRREDLIRKLGSRIVATPIVKTGVVRMHVTAPTPELAYQIVRFILDGLNAFDLVTRQSQARAERRFMEGRLGEARIELRTTDDSLQAFLQRNRDYKNSPELSFQADRLSREVQMRQQVYTSLAQAYEQAKIEEVRDTPVITIVERPEVPARPDSRGLVTSTVVALIGGASFGALVALLLASLERERTTNPAEMRAIESEFRQALGELARPWRLFRPTRHDH